MSNQLEIIIIFNIMWASRVHNGGGLQSIFSTQKHNISKSPRWRLKFSSIFIEYTFVLNWHAKTGARKLIGRGPIIGDFVKMVFTAKSKFMATTPLVYIPLVCDTMCISFAVLVSRKLMKVFTSRRMKWRQIRRPIGKATVRIVRLHCIYVAMG